MIVSAFPLFFSDGRAYITRRADNVLWATGTQRGASLYFLDLIPTTSGKFKPDSEASLVDRPRYQSAIGCLLYLSIGSRPDITFAVNRLAQFASAPNIDHWQAVLRLISYIHGTASLGITLGRDPSSPFCGFFDASYAEFLS